MTNKRHSLVLLISGRGSNMQAFIDASCRGQLDAQIKLVVSNRPNAQGLQRAAEHGIASAVIDHTDYPTREAFDAELATTIAAADPDLIILAGFMRILTADFVKRFEGRLINIHPSLLPDYPGLDTHQRAIANGDAVAGATVHYVTPELDGGPGILQVQVPIIDGDEPSDLAARILPFEHEIYPQAAAMHLSGEVSLRDGQAWCNGVALPRGGRRICIDSASDARAAVPKH